MKKILIYTNNCDAIQAENKEFCRIAGKTFLDENYTAKTDFVFIDFDSDLPVKKIIDKHSSSDAILCGFSANPNKSVVKKAYEFGLNHFIQRPNDFRAAVNSLGNPKEDYPEQTKTSKTGKKVLIVDDSPSIIELYRETLKIFNFDITALLSAKNALEVIPEEKFDLIIMDVVMPDLSGFELAKKIRASRVNRNTPFIFISADSATQSKIKGFEAGSYAYIEKPFDTSTLLAQITNILEIKTLQDNLFEKNELLDNIMQFSDNQFIQTDINFNVTSCNSRFFDVKSGTNLLTFLNKTEIDFSDNNPEDFTKSNRATMKIDFTTQKSDEIKYYKAVISKMYSKDGVLNGFLIMIMDRSEEKVLEQQKETFIATLTHDLKTPIRAEMQVLSLLLNGNYGTITAQQSEVISEILNSATFMQKMVDNLLFRYKHESKNFKIQKENGNYKLLIEDCISTLKYIIQSKKQTLKISYLTEQQEADFDRIELARVINNLISNASQFSPEKGEIKITVKSCGKNLVTMVEDKGIGIEKDDIKFLFDKYAPAHKKFRKVGSGLGLYISRAIVEAHGGHIGVKSKLNKGSTFEFYFPIKEAIPATPVMAAV